MNVIIQVFFFMLISWIVSRKDLVGDWRGVIDDKGRKVKIVLHVNAVGNQKKAMMEAISQEEQSISISSTHLQYPKVSLKIANSGTVFEGILSGDKITGTWIQSGRKLFLVMTK
jgi:hypothetical protein